MGWSTLNAKLDVILGRNSNGSSSSVRRGREKEIFREERRTTGVIDIVGTQHQRRVVHNPHKQVPPQNLEQERLRKAGPSENKTVEIDKSWKTAVVVIRRSADT
ncbi:hypothetical protein L484_016079 [Morus notabilis]|uniref:Uncharacterized protein n=1 Tax=Morus notabilis TaxID=981085 RepID=W9SG70_9ROSA|nr:hypothetical protein L484_016079 [Morus notabilis]